MKNLDATILEKRAIIAESFEFITWITKIKKVKSVISSRSESNLASYLQKEKAKLPSQITTPVVNTNTRISTVNKLSKKVKECRNEKICFGTSYR